MSNKYSRIDTPSLSDLALIWDESNSDWRLTTYTNILALMQSDLIFPDAGKPEAETQYSSPTVTGFTVQVNDNNLDTHLFLLMSAALADGTIKLPLNTNCKDKQIVSINVTNQITTLVIDGNGASGVYGSITSMGADDFVSYKYDIVTDAWFRIS